MDQASWLNRYGSVHLFGISPGRSTPLLRLAGLAYPENGTGSDALRTECDATELRRLLHAHVGVPSNELGHAFEESCLERLRWQWPEITFQAEHVREAIHGASELLPDVGAFTHAFIRALQTDYPVHPGLYDLPMALRKDPPPLPSVHVIEETPFIPFQPWKVVDDEKPFIVKSPSDVYRLNYFARHWPGLRVLHLTRNPAASINGLLDGWLYPGFHSHRVGRLAIDGYTNVTPGGNDWWKFDLFPGWEAYRNAPLVEVCAAQWVQAHEATLRWRAENPEADVLQVKFETFVCNPLEELERICHWLGVEPDLERSALSGVLPPVMATAPPRPCRWLDRTASLTPVLEQANITSLIAELGYSDRSEWI